ncbi:MAG: tetratricopeptide repeat protein [Proteobacteria bacterium]|nr:tetratricopeptide repeat protein [Pseudomonadota bacterium]
MRIDLMLEKTKTMVSRTAGAAGVCVFLLGGTINAQAQEKDTAFSVFDMPVMSGQLASVFRDLRAGRFDRAENILRDVIASYPGRAQNYYLLASVLAIRNQQENALDALREAIDKGFLNSQLMQQDTNLQSIRNTQRFQELVERVLKENAKKKAEGRENAGPYTVTKNEALISETNTIWNPRVGILTSAFRFAPDGAAPTVQNNDHPVSKQLNDWYRSGQAAGNYGDLYDNRDRGHSSLVQGLFPQLSFTRYSEAAKEAEIDNGLNDKILFNAITIGNSSTAVTKGPYWRSLPRLATSLPRTARLLYLQYIQNQMYIYPSVHDYMEKYGDVFLANTPYMLVSHGRSGSDRPLLQIVTGILAAFQPEVKDYLKKNGLVMPTVQMLIRSGNLRLFREAEYFTYKAHPPVFSVRDLDMPLIVRKTNALKIEDVPPMVKLTIQSESEPVGGVDDFSRVKEETLFATPSAIARVVRSTARDTKLTLSTEDTIIPTGQKVNYRWVVLQGDKEKITITPKNEAGTEAEITVSWHAPFPAKNPPNLTTNRVEIGVFADNGKNVSAPAFVNFLFPANQVRTYDDAGKIQSIDHQAAGQDQYVDPQIFAHRNWRDDYRYDEAGNLIGWTRTRAKSKDEFTHHGGRIVETDSLGRAVKAEITNYDVQQSDKGEILVSEQPTGEFIYYEYSDDTDQLGTLKRN